jgi:alpha-galactosidase
MNRTLTCFALLCLVLGAALFAPAPAHGLDNGVARTPPMGWNSWNKFACKDVNEAVVRAQADAMVSSGMKAAGYEFIVIDDCWQVGRDAAGNILADPEKYPSGIKALADYVHSKGLKFGIYTDAGTKTCAGRPGSMGHEYQDAQQYANWGVDYLKEDWCNTLPGQSSEASYTLMRDALAATGRPIVFSLCELARSEICGAPPATSRTAGTARRTGAATAFCRSSTSWGPSTAMPVPAIGMTRTCSRWATAA